jgi:hypothetical protein
LILETQFVYLLELTKQIKSCKCVKVKICGFEKEKKNRVHLFFWLLTAVERKLICDEEETFRTKSNTSMYYQSVLLHFKNLIKFFLYKEAESSGFDT